MFYSLLRIGEAISKEGETITFRKINRKGDLCIIIFDNDSKQVKCERKSLGSNDEIDYAYVGEAQARKPQISLTTIYPERILGFQTNGSDNKKLPTEKFALRVVRERLKDTPTGSMLNSILEWYKPEEYKEQILKECRFDCALYTVKIISNNREIEIAKDAFYRNSLIYSGETEPGECQFCGKKIVLKNPDYPNGTLLKIFITDKKGFLPGLAESAAALAHSVCPECREKLVRGDQYVEENLRASIRKLNVYVIPDMFANTGKEFLDTFVINNEGYIFDKLKELYYGEKTAERIAKELGEDARLTFVIGNKEQAKFRIRRVIPEVRYLRLVEIIKAFNKAKSVVYAGARNVTFNELYDILPMEKIGGGSDPKYFIEFFESMLLQIPLSKSYVYSVFLRSLRCRRYESCINSQTNKISLEELSLLAETYIYAMSLLNIMDNNVKDEETKSPLVFAENLGLSEGLKGVFLLGVLTAYVGKEQFNRGDTNKSILDKIDFEGMDVQDIIVYSNRLFESLRNYKQLDSETEMLYYEALSRIKTDSESLKDPQQNVFHLILGYSYKTRQFIMSGEKQKETSEKGS